MPRTTTRGEGKRHPLALRTTKKLRDALEKAAAKSGRSLAQEVEIRLEETLRQERRNWFYVGYKNWIAPLIPHKGSLIIVLGGASTITLEATPDDMEKLLHRMRYEDSSPVDDPLESDNQSPDPTLTPEEYRKEYREKHGLPPDMPVPKHPKRADPRTVAARGKKHAG